MGAIDNNRFSCFCTKLYFNHYQCVYELDKIKKTTICGGDSMKRLTEKETDNSYKIQGKNLDYHCTSKDKQGYVTYRGEHIDKLAEYEELGYTAEELKLCFNPPNVLYVIGDEYDSTVIHPVYPVDGEQIEFSNGNVYWNCRDIFDDL